MKNVVCLSLSSVCLSLCPSLFIFCLFFLYLPLHHSLFHWRLTATTKQFLWRKPLNKIYIQTSFTQSPHLAHKKRERERGKRKERRQNVFCTISQLSRAGKCRNMLVKIREMYLWARSPGKCGKQPLGGKVTRGCVNLTVCVLAAHNTHLGISPPCKIY